MSASPFRWGILGPGRIAHRFAQALDEVEGGEEALASDPQVDAVYIATPHRFHHAQARLCLEAGKPVLCEKPFTVNAAQAADLIQLAQAKGLFVMEALWSRFLPVYHQVRTWLDGGEIGAIKLVSSSFCFQPERDPFDRKFNHELAGGALLDLGVYNISLSQWAIGSDPSAVYAAAQLGDTGVDELTAATLVYPHDVVAQFTCSLLFGAANDLTIYGTEGFVRIHADFWQSSRATLFAHGRVSIAELPFRRNGFEYQIEEAMRCIRGGMDESEGMTLADTLANMKTMDRIREQIGLKYSFE